MSEKLSFVYWIPLLPFLGALINGMYAFSGAKLVRNFVHTVAIAAIFIPFLLSVKAFFVVTGLPEESRQVVVSLFPWIDVGAFKANVEFLIDPLSLTLMMVITGIGSLIHLYSAGYMSHEPSYARYFTYLNLFCFAMLVLVMSTGFVDAIPLYS